MIEIFTDGSGTISEGPACIGVAIFEDGGLVSEVGEHIGPGTNNVAELRAIRRGLHLAVERWGPDTPFIVYSDSTYAISAVTERWQPKENKHLILAIRKQVNACPELRFQHVDGHAGIYGNELADWLAWGARVQYFGEQGVQKKSRRQPVPVLAELREKRSALVACEKAPAKVPPAPKSPRPKKQPWQRNTLRSAR